MTAKRMLPLHFLFSEAHTGNIPFQTFAAWADGGGMSEEELNHAEVLGNSGPISGNVYQNFQLWHVPRFKPM